MNSCKNCANRVYDERRRIYVCKVYKHRIKDVDKYLDCEMHQKNDMNGGRRGE